MLLTGLACLASAVPEVPVIAGAPRTPKTRVISAGQAGIVEVAVVADLVRAQIAAALEAATGARAWTGRAAARGVLCNIAGTQAEGVEGTSSVQVGPKDIGLGVYL